MNNSQSRSTRYRNRRRQLANTRRLATESLENRVLLAGDTLAWHNADLPMDTNGNGSITPVDALAVIKELNDRGARQLDDSSAAIGLVDVNADGYVSPSDGLAVITYLNAANGEGDEKVRMRLEVTSRDNMDPLTILNPNQDFFLRLYTTDLTENPEGVFSAYVDVEYDANLADADGTIDYSQDFDDGKSGNVDVDGLMDEVGGFNQNQPDDGSAEQLVFSVPMRTDSNVGTLTFSANPPDILPIHEVLLQGDLTPILDDEILFVDVTVQIQNENAPTAVDDAYDGFEDVTLTRSAENGVLSNDDPSTGVTVSLVSGPSSGTLDLSPDGSFSYTPDPEYSGPDSFAYNVSDGVNSSNDATVSLTIASVNDAPTAIDDNYETEIETLLDRSDPADGILANDFDPDSPTITVVTNQILGPDNGQLSMNANGGFTYIPNAAFAGADSFSYIVTDGTTVSNRATVTIQVGTDPDAPVTSPDDYEVRAGDQLDVATPGVLGNDTDPNGASLVAELITTTANGSLTLNADGSFAYLPDGGFIGTDTFEYQAINVALASPITTVTIEVLDPSMNAPVANPDLYGVNEDETLVVITPNGVLANDTDADGDMLTASLVTQPQNGTVSLAPDGTFEYTPNPDYNGPDSFTYEASDGVGSDTATVSITVDPVQDAPVAVDDEYDITTNVTRFVLAPDGVLSNDSDVDGSPLTAQVEDEPSNGALTLNADGSFEYTPNTDFIGVDSFTYFASDGIDTADATVTLNVMPEPTGPLVNIRLAATDFGGDPITEIDAGQSFLIQMYVTDTSPEPVEGVFAAYADIEWDASRAFVDGDLAYNVDYPNGQQGGTLVPGLLDEAGAFSREDQGSDQEFLLLTVPMQATGSGDVTFATNPADILPFGNILLFDTLDVAVPVDQVAYGSTMLTVNGPTEPVAVADTYDADEGLLTVSAAEGVLANDVDIDGGPLTATLVSTTSNGALEFNDDGSFAYTADVGFVGEDTFTYLATEGDISSNTTTVSIIVGNPDPGSIAGSIYFDTNNNGVRDDSEKGLGGLTVTLTGIDIFGNPVSEEATTNSSGQYAFFDLAAGEYTVSEEKTHVVVDGKDTYGGIESEANDNFEIALSPGQNLTDLNFGERGLQPQYIRNPFFFSSRIPQGAGIAIDPDESTSWYYLDSGWNNMRDLRASLSDDGSTVTITGINDTGQLVRGSFTTSSSSVRVLGNATDGYFVRLIGASSSFPLSPVVEAVDALFGS